MHMKSLLSFGLLSLVLILTACSKDSDNESTVLNLNVQLELQRMIDQVLTDYKVLYPDYPGGLAMQVISKNGSYFVSTGLAAGTDNHIHFRAASNTKTFTSTAILMLHQLGKLNIYAHITDTIPGTDMPYVPENSDFDIPFKEQITILQLLQHKAGVFDVSNEIIPDTVSANVPYKGTNYMVWIMDQDSLHTFTFDELVAVNAICRAEGNLITTPYDLAHFLRLLVRGEGVLSQTTVNNLMLTPLIPPDTATKYTCGISYTDNLGYGHTGAHEGYLSLMATDPDVDFTVVVFTNAWNFEIGLPGIFEQFSLMVNECAFRAKGIAQ